MKMKQPSSIKEKLEIVSKQREEFQKKIEEEEIMQQAEEEMKSDPAYGYG